MPDLFDYLTWRGDIPMTQVPLGPVDNLILSALVYVHFNNLVPQEPGPSVSLKDAAETYLSLPEDRRGRVRCRQDLELLRALAAAPRFAPLRLTFYQDQFQPENEMQFAAMAVLLGDGSAFLSFRGTDSTLVGWKEDFNMAFMDAVPAQLAALRYVKRFAASFSGRLLLGGHSKGGNLAVYAASQSPAAIRQRVTAVYSNDGPGFTDHVIRSPGYRELLPRIDTYLPQSSVVGMLLEREDPYTVVKSRQIGLLQHDPYTWEVLGGDFVRMQSVTPGSRMTDLAIKRWLARLSPAEREDIVDTVFGLLSAGEASYARELIQPHNLQAVLRSLKNTDAASRRVMAQAIAGLVQTALNTFREGGE